MVWRSCGIWNNKSVVCVWLQVRLKLTGALKWCGKQQGHLTYREGGWLDRWRKLPAKINPTSKRKLRIWSTLKVALSQARRVASELVIWRQCWPYEMVRKGVSSRFTESTCKGKKILHGVSEQLLHFLFYHEAKDIGLHWWVVRKSPSCFCCWSFVSNQVKYGQNIGCYTKRVGPTTGKMENW